MTAMVGFPSGFSPTSMVPPGAVATGAYGVNQSAQGQDGSQASTTTSSRLLAPHAGAAASAMVNRPHYEFSDPTGVVMGQPNTMMNSMFASVRLQKVLGAPDPEAALAEYHQRMLDPHQTTTKQARRMANDFDAMAYGSKPTQEAVERMNRWGVKGFHDANVSMVAESGGEQIKGLSEQAKGVFNQRVAGDIVRKEATLAETIKAGTAPDIALREAYSPAKMPTDRFGMPIYEQWDDATRLKFARHQQQSQNLKAAELQGHPIDPKEQARLQTLEGELKQSYSPKYQEMLEKRGQFEAKRSSWDAHQAKVQDYRTQYDQLMDDRIKVNNELTKKMPWQRWWSEEGKALRQQRADINQKMKDLPKPAMTAELKALEQLGKEGHVPGVKMTPFGQLRQGANRLDTWLTKTLQANHLRSLNSANPIARTSARTAHFFENRVMGKWLPKAIEGLNKAIPGSGNLLMKGMTHLGTAALVWEGGRAAYNVSKGDYKNATLDLAGIAGGLAVMTPVLTTLMTGMTGFMGLVALPAALAFAGGWLGRETIGKLLVNTFNITNKEDRDNVELGKIAQKYGITPQPQPAEATAK